MEGVQGMRGGCKMPRDLGEPCDEELSGREEEFTALVTLEKLSDNFGKFMGRMIMEELLLEGFCEGFGVVWVPLNEKFADGEETLLDLRRKGG